MEGRLLLVPGPATRKRSGDAVSGSQSPFLLSSDRGTAGGGPGLCSWGWHREGKITGPLPSPPHPTPTPPVAGYLCLVGSGEPWALSQVQLVLTLHLVLLNKIKDAKLNVISDKH